MAQEIPCSVSRRRFLLGGGASVILFGLAGTLSFGYAAGQDAWVENVIRSNLPGVKLDDGSLSLFVRNVRATGILGARRHRLAIVLDQLLPALPPVVPRLRRAVEGRERLVLTEFLLGSNIFQAEDPTRETVTYVGSPFACGNPFAVFATEDISPRTEPDFARRRPTSLVRLASGGARSRSRRQKGTQR